MFARRRNRQAPLLCAALLCVVVPASGAAATPGNTLWVDRTGGSPPSSTWARDLLLSPDGSTLYVVGDTRAEFGTDVRISAYDASSGQKVWQRRYDGAGLSDTTPSVAVSPSGARVYVTGTSEFPDAHDGVFAIALDAGSGDLLWRRRALSRAEEAPFASAIQANGRGVFIATDERGPVVIHALDPATGASRWVKELRCLSGSAEDMALRSGTLVAGGYCFEGDSDDGDGWVAAFDTVTGDRSWLRWYRTEGFDVVQSLRFGPDAARIYVGGKLDDVLHEVRGEVFVRAISVATGDPAWTWMSNPPVGVDDDRLLMDTGPDGSINLTYTMHTAADQVMVAFALEPDGDAAWPARVALDGPDQRLLADAVDVSPDGRRFYVTGTGTIEPDDEILGPLTVVFRARAGGDPVWHRMVGAGSGRGLDVTVSPDSASVYVSGYRRFEEAWYVEAFSAT